MSFRKRVSDHFTKVKEKHKEPHIRKRYIFLGIGIAVVIIIALLILLGVRFNFLITDELHITLDPRQQIIMTDYNKPVNLNFTVQNTNFWFCKTMCTFVVFDPYEEKVLSSENDTLKSNSIVNKVYTFTLDTNGRGERLFYFSAQCHNINSGLCTTDEHPVERDALVSVRYNLPPEEEQIRQEIQAQLGNYAQDAKTLREDVETTNGLISDIRKSTSTGADISIYSNHADDAETFLAEAEQLWGKNGYVALSKSFSGERKTQMEMDVQDLSAMHQEMMNEILEYNADVTALHDLDWNRERLNDAYALFTAEQNYTGISDVYMLWKEIDALFGGMAYSFENIVAKSDAINSTVTAFHTMMERYELENAAFTERVHRRLVEEEQTLKKVRESRNMSMNLSLTNNTCTDMSHVLSSYDALDTFAENASSAYISYENNTEFQVMKEAYMNDALGISEVVLVNGTFFFSNMSVNDSLGLTEKDYYAVLMFNRSGLQLLYGDYCNSSIILVKKYALQDISAIMTTNHSYVEKSFSFPDNPEECCVFNGCSECGGNMSSYPVIFIHGHSFNINDPVERELNGFSKMQDRLSNDSLYINAGDIDFTTSLENNEVWTRMTTPVSVRASYYYITYYDVGDYKVSSMKNEGIENYAIRLKELIDIVLAKTGSSKVDIVAHSMGGLVARDYVELFGEEHVDKMILIATPNNGVTGRVMDFCPRIGNRKECEDMSEGSIFLKRLNTPENIPKTIKVVTIRGVGCNTDGSDGDGAVHATNVALGFAKNYEVKGNCTDFLGISLHNDLMDPDKYPEVYKIVKESLKD